MAVVPSGPNWTQPPTIPQLKKKEAGLEIYATGKYALWLPYEELLVLLRVTYKIESSPHTVEVIGLKSKILTFHWYKDSSTCALRNDFWPKSLLSRHQALLDFMLVGHFLLLDLATVCWTFNIISVLCCYGFSVIGHFISWMFYVRVYYTFKCQHSWDSNM
jgi:hypothetical protein